MAFNLANAVPVNQENYMPGEKMSDADFEKQWSQSMANAPQNNEIVQTDKNIVAENNVPQAMPEQKGFNLANAEPVYDTGTGTRFTQAQLDAAKNPETLQQTLKKELADNPIKAKMAAAGTALSDLYYGGKQLVGMDSPKNRQDIANNKTISDANAGSALIGNTALYALGGIAPALNTVKGATIASGVAGAVAPTQDSNIVAGKVKNALKGAAVGYAGAKLAQAVGDIVANKAANLANKATKNATTDNSLKQAVDVGYKVPPDYAGGGAVSRTLGGLSGKQKTAEQAIINNQDITNNLAKTGLGLPKNSSLSEAAIDDLKAPHNAVYQEASSLPAGVIDQITTKSQGTGKEVTKDITKSGEQLVNEIKNARDDARAAWKSFNSGMSANPNDLRTQAVASGKLADKLEGQLNDLAQQNGKTDLLNRLKDARSNLAKIYTYEDALNPETGNINAALIGKALKKGKPLDDSAMQIGKFANAFGDLAKIPKTREANPITPLDIVTGGLWPAARVTSRAAVLSKPVQKAMANPSYQVGNTAKLLKATLASRYAPMALTGVALPALAK